MELISIMNQFAKFARTLESFTPDQLQKLSNASASQMQQLHDAEDTESDLDAADGDPISDGSDNLVDAAKIDDNKSGSDSDKDDGDMSIDKDYDDNAMTVTPTGRNKDQDGAVIELDLPNDAVDTTIVIDHSDSSDVDTHQPSTSYSFAGSPPRKSTALSAKVKHLGTSTSTGEIPTSKKAKGTDTERSADTTIEGLDGGQDD